MEHAPSAEQLDELKAKAERLEQLNANRKAANARYMRNKALTMIKLPIEARNALKRHCEENNITLLEGIVRAINQLIDKHRAPATPTNTEIKQKQKTKGCYPSKDSSQRSKQMKKEIMMMIQQGLSDEEIKEKLETIGFGTRQFESTLKKIREDLSK